MQAYLENSWEAISQEQWNALASASATNTVFQTYGWHVSWWKTFSKKDLKPFVICVKEKERFVGIAPLYILFKGRWRIVKFIGTGHADYCDFLYPKGRLETLEKMFSFLAKEKERWDAVALDHIPQESPTVRALIPYSRKGKLYCIHYSSLPCPAIIFDTDKKNVQEILKKKSIKRHFRYFKKKEGYEVLHLTDAKMIEPFWEDFFKQHISRRAVTRDPSLFLNKDNQEFYRNLLEGLSSSGSIVFTVLQSEGRPIAYHFGFNFNGKFIWYKPSFEVALARHAPGEVLFKELLEYASSHNLKEFDFTTGKEGFKLRFSNKVRKNLSFKIFKSKRILWLDMIRSSLNIIRRR